MYSHKNLRSVTEERDAEAKRFLPRHYDDAVLDGIVDKPGSVMNVQLLHDVVPVGIDSANADIQSCRDL